MHDCEGLLLADIDTEDCERGKFDLDVAGHYARPDVFRLEVDTTSRKAVTFRQSPPFPESNLHKNLDGVGTNFGESACERNDLV
jgi:hypothetical protein